MSELALDERLCLALYNASRAMTARYRPLLREAGLTYPQYLVMVLLWQDGTASVGRIGERLRLDSSTLSPLLKRLEAMDFVTRSRDPLDERSVLIDLTPRGRRLKVRLAGIPDAICDATAMTGAAQADLVDVLKQLVRALDNPVTV